MNILLIISNIFLILVSCSGNSRKSGNLEIIINYKNPKYQLGNGKPCDYFESGCDYVNSLKVTIGNRTKEFKQREFFRWNVDLYFHPEDGFNVDIGSIQLELQVMDEDWTKNDFIGLYKFKLDPDFDPTLRYEMEDISESHNHNKNIKATIVKYQIKCLDDFYGSACERHCDNNHPNYKCDKNGVKTCEDGYFGDHCEIFNVCSELPCAVGAKCQSVPGRKRICLCDDDKEYEKCYPEADICKEITCHNGGSCQVNSDYNPECNCRNGYHGTFCQLAASTCFSSDTHNATVLERLRSINTTEQCLNNGTCEEDDEDEFEPFKCTCTRFWSGKQCEIENKLVKITFVIFIVLLVLGLLLCLTIFIAKIIQRKRLDQKIRLNYRLGEDSDYLFLEKDVQ